jgi:mono/diheme cytochrome c family protein
MAKVIWTVVVIIAIVAIVGAFVVFGGAYNVAASQPHSGLTLWLIEHTVDNSVESHSKDVQIPDDLTDSTMIAVGFGHYDEMCVDCHGAPGIKPEEFADGLYPHAPNLAKSTTDMSAQELFWITKNGLKFSGMPAFGSTHTDEQITDIVAFLKKLPQMSPADYQAMKGTGAGEEMESEEEGHSDSH